LRVVGGTTTSGHSSSQAAAAGSAASQRTSFPEATIQRLMSLGFSQAQVIDELSRSNGDADQAMASLFAKSFQLP